MFYNPHLSPVQESDSFKKKKKLLEEIEKESNKKLQKMIEIICSNNDSLKRNYERFMQYHHNFFINVIRRIV
jgi:hypothetical protein